MSTPFPPVVPLPDDDDHPTDRLVPTREVDGRESIDPDIDDALIDSAAADRLAAGADDEDDELLADRDDDLDDGELDDDVFEDDER